jgi:predicted DNA-binding protein (MmcQ/YjbR family)
MTTRRLDLERIRAFLVRLPHTVESVTESSHWGDKLVFRVGHRDVGGKMFCQVDFEDDGRVILSFTTDPARFRELLEIDGVSPARYRARLHWIAVEDGGAIPVRALEDLLREASAIVMRKLPSKTRAILASPATARKARS